MKTYNSIILTASTFILLALLGGCGGGSGGSAGGAPAPVPTATLTVTGVASEGSLIVGKTVKLKDANGTAAPGTTTDATSGRFSIDVTNLTAPFLVTVTGTGGSYVSLAPAAGTANVNPITTMVVAFAAATSDISGLFTSFTSAQLATINNSYAAKAALVTTSLQAALPTGVTAADYFTGTITAGSGMDAVFDMYHISVDPAVGVTVTTKDPSVTTLLTIPVTTVTANSNQPLPVMTDPPTPVANAGTTQNVLVGATVTLDGSGSSNALTYLWTVTSKPSGSSATLSSTTVAKPTFTADVAGIYIFSLVVSDGKVGSTAATVSVISISNTGTVATFW